MTPQTTIKWVAALAIGLCACGDGTGPLDGDDILLTVAGSIIQPDLTLTLLDVEMLIDGQVVGTEQSTAPQAALVLGGQIHNAKVGAHTVGFRIVGQTASPTVYELSAMVDARRLGGNSQEIVLGPLTKAVATGEVVTFNVSVNPP
jgi:hypothetical protein